MKAAQECRFLLLSLRAIQSSTKPAMRPPPPYYSFFIALSNAV